MSVATVTNIRYGPTPSTTATLPLTHAVVCSPEHGSTRHGQQIYLSCQFLFFSSRLPSYFGIWLSETFLGHSINQLFLCKLWSSGLFTPWTPLITWPLLIHSHSWRYLWIFFGSLLNIDWLWLLDFMNFSSHVRHKKSEQNNSQHLKTINVQSKSSIPHICHFFYTDKIFGE